MPKKATKANGYCRPDCAITLYFDPKDSFNPKDPKSYDFLYYCTSSSTGWTVQTGGSIHPPSRSRIVEIRLDRHVLVAGQSLMFAAFQVGKDVFWQSELPSHWAPKDELLRDFGVRMLTPGYPEKGSMTWKTGEPLLFDMTAATDRFFYRLALSTKSGPLMWDDPKIYDDGSQ